MASIKTFTIFAGVNGAGKSTLFATDTAADLGVLLNTDEIVKGKGWDWKEPRAQIEAGKELLKLQKECLDKEVSFNQETTLSGISIIKCIEAAKAKGYKIHLRYVGVNSPEIAKERVAKRIALGGHGVSQETIDRRFLTSKENFKKVFPLCDTVNIYDNSGDGLVLVASYVKGKLNRTSSPCGWVDELLASIKQI